MFGHDHHDEDDDQVVNPSTTPVNEALMGVNDDAGDDSASQDNSSAPTVDEPTEDASPTSDAPADDELEEETITEDAPASSSSDSSSNDLLDIKRHALQDLSPLIGHLDQSPEERFKTTMMMIQASDDQSLVAGAYEAAKGISDEKARAQALLDIVNEINYFTQAKKD